MRQSQCLWYSASTVGQAPDKTANSTYSILWKGDEQVFEWNILTTSDAEDRWRRLATCMSVVRCQCTNDKKHQICCFSFILQRTENEQLCEVWLHIDTAENRKRTTVFEVWLHIHIAENRKRTTAFEVWPHIHIAENRKWTSVWRLTPHPYCRERGEGPQCSKADSTFILQRTEKGQQRWLHIHYALDTCSMAVHIGWHYIHGTVDYSRTTVFGGCAHICYTMKKNSITIFWNWLLDHDAENTGLTTGVWRLTRHSFYNTISKDRTIHMVDS